MDEQKRKNVLKFVNEKGGIELSVEENSAKHWIESYR